MKSLHRWHRHADEARGRRLGQRRLGFRQAPAVLALRPVDEVANVALFLASDEASHVTGAEWSVDGGATAGDSSLSG